MVSYNKAVITQQGGHHTIKSLYLFFLLGDVRKWLQPRVVFPHWVLISERPLIHHSHRGD